MPNSHVATVEFQNREDVPTGLTKDKKRIDGQEISVSLAWQSTLYVTNFADSVDDAWVRQLFSQVCAALIQAHRLNHFLTNSASLV